MTEANELMLAQRSAQLFVLASDWFDRLQGAYRAGDRTEFAVCRLAHNMCVESHDVVLREIKTLCLPHQTP